jgi:hypothetical protein
VNPKSVIVEKELVVTGGRELLEKSSVVAIWTVLFSLTDVEEMVLMSFVGVFSTVVGEVSVTVANPALSVVDMLFPGKLGSVISLLVVPLYPVSGCVTVDNTPVWVMSLFASVVNKVSFSASASMVVNKVFSVSDSVVVKKVLPPISGSVAVKETSLSVTGSVVVNKAVLVSGSVVENKVSLSVFSSVVNEAVLVSGSVVESEVSLSVSGSAVNEAVLVSGSVVENEVSLSVSVVKDSSLSVLGSMVSNKVPSSVVLIGLTVFSLVVCSGSNVKAAISLLS